MKYLKKIIYSLIFIILFFSSFVQPNNIEKNVLENGLTIITWEIHNNPIVSVDVWVKTGSINEDNKISGLSHFFEHMLFKGTKKYKVGEIDNLVEGIGGNLNAGTSKDFTHYYLTVPSSYLDLALEIEADMMINSEFPLEEIEKEREVILEEISRKEDIPGDFLEEIFFKTAFTIHPYRRPVLGTKESIEKIKREDFLNYKDKYYIPNNMSIIIVGDFNKEKAIAKIKTLFKDFKAKEKPLENKLIEPEQKEVREVIMEKDLKQTYLVLGFHAPSVFDIPDVYCMDLILTLLGEGRSSRLYKELKQKKQIVLDIDCDFLTQKQPGLFFVSATLDPKNINKVKDEILKEINKLKNEEIPEKELEKAKNLLESQVEFDIETLSGKSSYLGFYETIDKMDFAISYLDEIKKINAKQIKEVANKYFKENTYTFCALTPKVKK